MMIDEVFRDLPTLETKRMILRKLRMEDVPDVHAYASDPEVSRHVAWDTHRSMEDSRTFVGSVIEQYNNGLVSTWGIAEKESGRVIGTCGFVYWNIDHGRSEIGYAIGRDYWGRGMMSEAARAMLKFGFGRMGLNRIEARCEVDNIASARVMEKIGMSYEGILREQMFVKGSYRDLKMYAILKREWDGAE